jgi:ABC-type nitrate/sulfonate/bicarbonate transport system permease component
LPLFVVWFGTGELPKVLLIASGVAVVMLLGTHHAVRAVPRVYLDAARSLGSSSRLVFRRVVVPFALPRVLSSLRVAVALAWVTIVVAELIDARIPSLGYLLALSGAYPRVPQMLIALATVGLLVLVFDSLTLLLHRGATRWMKRAA